MFKLPRDGPVYAEHVFQRAENLIHARIWEGIRIERLRRWRQNFREEIEEYFGACCLDALVYRSGDQTEALLRHLWTRSLPTLQRQIRGADAPRWLDRLRSKSHDAGICVVPVVNQRQITKSGYGIGRLLEKKLRVRSRYIKAVQSVDLGRLDTIVFVDDFLGGGTQFEDLLVQESLPARTSADIVYAPLAAHTIGVQRLTQSFPALHITAADLLDDSHRFFTDANHAFNDGLNSSKTAGEFYEELTRKYRVPRMKPIRDVEHLRVAYAFEHAAPNNSLEIFWAESAEWKPLFDR